MTYVRKKSQKQENRTAKEFGGKTQIASGALWTAKGDVRTSSFLIENKFTDADFFKLDSKIWKKIFEEATRDGNRTPIMQVDIQDLQLVIADIWDIKEWLPDYLMAVHWGTNNQSMKLNKDIVGLIRHNKEYISISFPNKQLGVVLLEDLKRDSSVLD